MKIAIIGYGKMGQALEEVAQKRGHEIVLRSTALEPFVPEDLKNCDVAIEFTEPESAVTNILKCFEANVPVVVGTTGWYGRFKEVEQLCLQGNHTIFHATNYSPGVNMLFALNEKLALLMNDFEEYEPGILEIHHTEKKDSPSGTAISLAEGIIYNLKRKKHWVNHLSDEADELSIVSDRTAGVPGTHVISYTSADDELTLRHDARNRTGFARGAVMAAEWVKEKKGVYTMRHLLNI